MWRQSKLIPFLLLFVCFLCVQSGVCGKNVYLLISHLKCLLDVLVWIQAVTKGNHPAFHLRRSYALELMGSRASWGDGGGGDPSPEQDSELYQLISLSVVVLFLVRERKKNKLMVPTREKFVHSHRLVLLILNKMTGSFYSTHHCFCFVFGENSKPVRP